MDPTTMSTQLKWPHIVERAGPRKKVKASKLAIDPLTLTKGDLHDIGETVRDVTSEGLQEFMKEHQTVLEAIRAQLQELQVWPLQEGTLSTHVAAGTLAAEQMLHLRMAYTTVFPVGVLVSSDAMDQMMVSMMKGLGLNLASLPWEMLYQL